MKQQRRLGAGSAGLITLAALALAGTQNAAAQGDRQRFAVVIGISDYQNPDVPDLQFAAADARAFHDFLLSPAAGMGGFDPANVRLLVEEQATARAVRTALADALQGATPGDLVIIYLAGHGVPDPSRLEDFYFLSHDADRRELRETAVDFDWISELLRESHTYQTILFTDAGRTATVGPTGRAALRPNEVNEVLTQQPAEPAGRFVAFTASQPGQISQEGAQWGGGHGVFTYYLLRGLGGEADEDRDRVVNLGELMEYTRNGVRRETRNAQIPTISLTAYDRLWPMATVVAR